MGKLKVSKLMEKYVIEHEPSNCDCWPFLSARSAKLLRRLAPHKHPRQTHPRGKGAERDFAPSMVDVSKQFPATATVVEMHRPKSFRNFIWEPGKYDAHIRFVHVMNTITAWLLD
jgi:hypothetical protein